MESRAPGHWIECGGHPNSTFCIAHRERITYDSWEKNDNRPKKPGARGCEIEALGQVLSVAARHKAAREQEESLARQAERERERERDF